MENEIEASGGELTCFYCTRRAERDDKVGGVTTFKGADIRVVGEAISAWARVFESLRVDGPVASIRWYDIFIFNVESNTANLRDLVYLTRGITCKWIVGVYVDTPHPHLRWTRLIQLNNASNALTLFVLGGHNQRKVLTM